ncbi:MAG: GNAT family N-acetyltransferase [Clostridia bacterium]|nr:GNAT family N-acetyltransferase [Clostridia bacterium]
MPFLDIFKKDSSLDIKIKETFANPPTLSTQRLLLVKISPEHASDMYEYSCDPDVTRYLTWSCHSSVKETERYIKLLQKRYTAGVFNDWGLIHKETGKFIGTCGFTSFDYEKNTAEIGYVLSKDFWGQGLAAEAARAVMEFGFENFGLDGYCAKCIEGNDASMRVMQKVGMTFEGIYKNGMFIKGSYKTIIVYNVTKEKYYSHKQESI